VSRVKLLTKELREKLLKLYTTEVQAAKAPAVMKFFALDNNWT
jgi:hypothetical protein